MTNIRDAYDRLREEIRRAEADFGRVPGSVCLLAVSKLRSVTDICAAMTCGQRHFAENYLQEALEKIQALNDPELTWYFIGPVQSNKTRPIAEHFHWVHSIDRVKIARRLHDARPDHLPPLNVCIQINFSNEESKAGITPGDLPAFIKDCSGLGKL
ncbi:MAG: YggS family pyridoxal phosphate-dependent enzyme, partial [Gammaproteobacteria bacterium]